MDVARREAAFPGRENLPLEAWMDEPCCTLLDLMQALGWSLMEQKHRFLCEGPSWPRWTATHTRHLSQKSVPSQGCTARLRPGESRRAPPQNPDAYAPARCPLPPLSCPRAVGTQTCAHGLPGPLHRPAQSQARGAGAPHPAPSQPHSTL